HFGGTVVCHLEGAACGVDGSAGGAAGGVGSTVEFAAVARAGMGCGGGAGAGMLNSTDGSYRGQAMFNILFFRLGPAGADLQSLGVKPEELRYRGMNAYTPGAPAADRAWTEEIARRTGFGRLLGWYARHPGSTLGFLAETLREGAPEMRPVNLGNFRAADGRAPGARTERFGMWSQWRSELLRRWPWHMVAWYAVFLAGCLASGSPVRWVAMGILALGAGEFAAAALGDALDAGRHLFLFHAATDLTVCFAAGWLLEKWLLEWLLQNTMRHTPETPNAATHGIHRRARRGGVHSRAGR